MSRFQVDEFATSSRDSPGLKVAKEILRKDGFPADKCLQLVDRHLDPAKFSHLAPEPGKPNVYLVVPSTSAMNRLPRYFAERLAAAYPGAIVDDWATPLRETRSALKGGLRKILEPPAFAIDPAAIARIPPHARLILVDDVVTTGLTIRSLREGLHSLGRQAFGVVSLAQSELRKATERDIERLSKKLGEPSLYREILGVYGNQLKHSANWTERTLHSEGATIDERIRLEVRAYFTSEYRRLQAIGLAYEGPARGAVFGRALIERAQRPRAPGAELSEGISR